MTGLPTLHTDRLTLRAPRPEDWEAYAAFATSERSKGVGGPFPLGQAWRQFATLWGHEALRGFGRFVVTRRGEDRAIGLVGPFHPYDWPEPEIGWSLFEGEGEGLAFEAATEARRFAYGTLGWTTAISVVMPDNHRSVALARRMGCTPDGSFVHPQWGEMPIWRHPAPEALR